MRSCFVNEAKQKMSFPFYAPKENNEVEEDDDFFNFLFQFLKENMRICSVKC